MKSTNKKMVMGVVVATAIGTGLGILFAPNKGSKTRKRMKLKVTDTSDEISDRLNHAKDELAKSANDKKKVFNKKLDDAISAMSNKADDIITTLESKLEDVKKKNAKLHK